MAEGTALAIAAAVVVAAALIILILRSGRGEAAARAEAARLAAAVEALARSQTEQAGRLSQLAETQTAAQAQLARTIEERLEAVSKRLGDGLTQHTEKTGETMTELHKRLAVIDVAQSNLTQLTEQVVGLQDILANKQAAGAFGEIQLENLVRDALPPTAYAFQAQLSNGRRADCLLTLPNPPGAIAVDSKFPLASYDAVRKAGDEAARTQAMRAFATAVKNHVRDIAERYIIPGETAESALMFVPSEAVYAELHASLREVVEMSFRAKVWIVSPTTLMATLTTVRAVLRDARMREQAGVIQKEVAAMAADVRRLDERVANLGRHFEQAGGDIREIRISTEKVIKRADRIEEVQLGDDPAREELLPAEAGGS